MLLNEFMKLRGQQIIANKPSSEVKNPASETPDGKTFADTLKAKIEKGSAVEFSNHALRRLDSRSVDISENDKLERLNEGVKTAAEKGSSEALVLVDSTAFIVNIPNNKVITTMELEELKGNAFTNIDSTVIM
ncbi:MAG: hypothetical protein FWH20_01000 [Oscillospiraceae bacterium]|nr:hypothetical protein [Oscillospiraceae bacterium]